MATSDLQETQTLYLGRQGENEVLTVEFDLSEFVEELGAGTATLLHKRSSDSEPYTVETTTSGNVLTWVVTNADTYAAGQGTCEIRWAVGDKLKKSAIFNTTVTASLVGSAEKPGSVVYLSALTPETIADTLGCEPGNLMAEIVYGEATLAEVLKVWPNCYLRVDNPTTTTTEYIAQPYARNKSTSCTFVVATSDTIYLCSISTANGWRMNQYTIAKKNTVPTQASYSGGVITFSNSDGTSLFTVTIS